MPHCAAFGCNFQSKGNTGSDVSIHKFPEDKKRRKKWQAACGRTQLPKAPYLCSQHFSPDSFVDFSRRRLMKELLGATGYKRKLKPDAFPSVFPHKESKRPRKASEMRVKKRDREEMLDALLNGQPVSVSATTSGESSDSQPLIKDEDHISPIHTSVSVCSSTTMCCPNMIDAATQTDFLTSTSDAAVQWPADVQQAIAKDHTYPVHNMRDCGQEEHTGSLISFDYGADLLLAKHERTRAKQKTAVSFVKSDKIGLFEEVSVQVSCLLQLFDRCLQCRRGACSLLTRREETVLRVTQQCWTCRFINEWTSHSQSADGQKAPGDKEEADKEKKAKDIEEEGLDQEEEDREAEREEEESEETEEEEEEEERDQDKEEDEEDEKRQRKSKRKRRDSDEDWAPDMEELNREFARESSDDDEGSIDEDSDKDSDKDDDDDGDRAPELFVWCRECEVEASSGCFRHRHPQLYCCVYCDADHTGDIGTRSTCYSEEPLCPSGEACGTSTPEADCRLEVASRGTDGPACSGKQDGTNGNQDKTEHNLPINAISKGPHSLSNQSSVAAEIPHTKSKQTGGTTEGLLTTSSQPHVNSEIPLSANSQRNTRNGGIQDGGTGCELESTNSKPPFAVYFSDPYSLQSHIDQCHDRPSSQRQLCPDCGKIFKHNGAMAHNCEHKVKLFICATCEKRFSTKAGLHIHQYVHKEDYRVYCQFCFKGFRQTVDKVKHEESHQGEALKFYCCQCPERFADRQSRSVHRKTHSTENRFFCKYCDKGFKERDNLQRHTLLHTGQKPFTCEVCDRSFNQKGHLTSHMRLHTGERPFKCQQCERSFNHNVSLKNHLQRHHGPKTATAEQENQE